MTEGIIAAPAFPLASFMIDPASSRPRPHLVAIGVDEAALRAVSDALRQAGTSLAVVPYDPGSDTVRFDALATSTPGVIFQIRCLTSGRLAFDYASEASHALLGIAPGDLLGQGSRFLDCLLAEEVSGFFSAIRLAAEPGASLNWEGRIRSAAGDVKWINLRGTVRRMESGELLGEGVMWNITHSKRTELELRESRRQLVALSNHLEAAKEEERERIARDIHDVVGGHLVAIKIEASLLAAKLDGDPAQVRGRVAAIERLLDEAIATVSRVTRELRPGILKDFGLGAAIESHAEDFAQRTGIACRIRCMDDDIQMSEAAAIALFRIFQEALTNVCKHAHATAVDIRLAQEGDEVILEICDNGRGLATGDVDKPRSFGLRGMRERIASLGGQFSIGAGETCGTRLRLVVPLDANGEAAPGAEA